MALSLSPKLRLPVMESPVTATKFVAAEVAAVPRPRLVRAEDADAKSDRLLLTNKAPCPVAPVAPVGMPNANVAMPAELSATVAVAEPPTDTVETVTAAPTTTVSACGLPVEL